MMEKGKIVDFVELTQAINGTIVPSKYAYLYVLKEDGKTEHIICLRNPTKKILEFVFKTDNMEEIKGKEILYEVGENGILEGLVPFEAASEELIRKYEEMKKGREHGSK